MVLECVQVDKLLEEEKLYKRKNGQLWVELKLMEEYLDWHCELDLEEKSYISLRYLKSFFEKCFEELNGRNLKMENSCLGRLLFKKSTNSFYPKCWSKIDFSVLGCWVCWYGDTCYETVGCWSQRSKLVNRSSVVASYLITYWCRRHVSMSASG